MTLTYNCFFYSYSIRFHTKTTETTERTCALCLDPLPNGTDQKICDSCLKKHNFPAKILPPHPPQPSMVPPPFRRPESDLECNLCKKTLASEAKLQEHLVEHTFAGCEDRGFNCYICSSVFTSAAGLISHMNDQHGANSKPYDCNRCTVKYFFRAELDHHSFVHESASATASNDLALMNENSNSVDRDVASKSKNESGVKKKRTLRQSESPDIKQEQVDEIEEQADEDEYIEVEEPKVNEKDENKLDDENEVGSNSCDSPKRDENDEQEDINADEN